MSYWSQRKTEEHACIDCGYVYMRAEGEPTRCGQCYRRERFWAEQRQRDLVWSCRPARMIKGPPTLWDALYG